MSILKYGVEGEGKIVKYLIGIPYVNRPDLLKVAVNSIKAYWPHLVIVDCSDGRDLRTSNNLPADVSVYEPPVFLTLSQSLNLLRQLAIEQQCDVMMYMHTDAEAHEGTPEQLLSIVETLLTNKEKKWGAAFTNYDTLAVYNMEAVKAIGMWDTILTAYFIDNDYYRRMSLAGYELIDTGLAVSHHNGSSTIRSDLRRGFLNSITFPMYQYYYEQKWGGTPGKELFSTPFNL